MVNTKEVAPNQSELIIRPKSVAEEFEYLWEMLGMMPFLREQGYQVELPDDPKFKALAGDGLAYKQANQEELFGYFRTKIYDPKFFDRGLELLEAERSRIESVFPIFSKLNKLWGFRVFSAYQITLTRYGPGGGYSSSEGVMTMLLKSDGTFKRQDPGVAPIHEMIHIGVEEPIVKEFGLGHWEKERLVDLICQTGFAFVLPDYQLQRLGDSRIDPYVNLKLLDSLPKSMAKYVADFSRNEVHV